MPFAPHIRMTMLGRLGTGDGFEKFSYGLNIAPNEAAPIIDFFGLEPNNDVFTAWAQAAADYHTRATTAINPLARLMEVKFAHIGADGKYTSDPVLKVVSQNGVGGGGTTNLSTLPQSALAVSLETARRGPRGKGRFFLPMPSLGIDSASGLVAVAAAEGVRGSTQTFLNAINDQPGLDVLDLRVVVASSFGVNTVVNEVRVGRVPDTIRSRRRSIPENYTAPLAIT